MGRRVEVSGKVVRETTAAYLVDVGEEEDIWLPKSQCEIEDDCTIIVEEWLARERGLI